MNSSRYLVARLLLAFGIARKNKRLTEAADEMNLLRQAEELFGQDVWEAVGEIEGVNVEYWTLRKLKIKIEKLKETIQEADEVLSSSQEEKNTVLTRTNEECQELDAKRRTFLKEADALIAERDQIIAQAKAIKRQFGALMTKIEVLSQEKGGESIIEKEKIKIEALKEDLKKLKLVREEIGAKVQAVNSNVASIEAVLGEDRKKLRDQASSVYQSIGKANRNISKIVAEVGMLESEMKIHFMGIGSYISSQVGIDPSCAEVGKKYAPIIARMQSLRSSIALNQRLAAMASN